MRSSLQYLQSQKGIVSEGIKKAIISEVPIIYTITDEVSLIFDILRDDQIIESSLGTCDKRQVEKRANVLFSVEEFSSWLDNPDSSVVSVLFLPPFTNEYVQNNAIDNIEKCLFQFVQLYFESKPIKSGNTTAIKGSTIIIVSPTMPTIPPFIVPFSRVIQVPPIQGEELSLFISSLVKEHDGDPIDANGYISDKDYLNKIANNLRGLGKNKIREIFVTLKDELGYVHVELFKKAQFNSIIRIIQKEKSQLIENSGILKLEKPIDDSEYTMDSMKGLKEWLDKVSFTMKDPLAAKTKAGLNPLKGVLISGIPGSGKSLMAKVVSAAFDLPLISMSMGLLMGKHLGESEHRLDEALRLIEALSPCVVWIDEIEKDMSGSSNGESDGGTARRMFAQLLKWMQEKESRGVSCFVFATANDISNLPPELFRSGRFDAKFYTFMPSLDECDTIFQSIIDKQKEFFDDTMVSSNQDNDKYESGFFKNILERYHKKEGHENSCKFLTGADIASLIEMAKRSVYHDHITKDNESFIYERDKFEKAVYNALDELRCYGETNMIDIASCFIRLAQRNFNPAGSSFIATSLLDLNEEVLNDPPKALQSEYDKKLFAQLKNHVSKFFESKNK